MPAYTPPKGLSPSGISTWMQCPLKFKVEKIDRIPGPPSLDAMIGTFVHEVLEYLFKLEPHERTAKATIEIAKQRWGAQWSSEFQQTFHPTPEELRHIMWRARWATEAYFNIEDPTAVHPKGSECKLTGEIEGARILGILDRWDVIEDGRARISDYKTGKPSRPPYDKEKILQLMIYVILFEQNYDQDVAEAELLYLKGEGKRVVYEPTSVRVQEATETVGRVWREIQTACETGEFETRPGKLCDWCNFKPNCPAFS